jgi:high affinity Mn2+ porin
MFVRLSLADGRYETFDFTDIDRSGAAGLSMTGSRWGRPADVVAGVFVVNGASRDRIDFLRAGGLGVLIGDGIGQPANAGTEQILETYYNVAATKWLNVTIDYQLVNHPAYNVDRGPVHVSAVSGGPRFSRWRGFVRFMRDARTEKHPGANQARHGDQ